MHPRPARKSPPLLGRGIATRATLFLLMAVLLGNLSPLVDHFLHPEIPYFDQEHLIVGGVTFGVSVILFALLILYEIRLSRALARTLEAILPICSYCKKIRPPEAPPGDPGSWQRMEYYISEQADTRFSHGVCPECLAANLSEVEPPAP